MKLANRFFIWSVLLLGGVLVLGGVSVWNVAGMWQVARGSTAEYDVMDRADAINTRVVWLRDSLRGADAPQYRDVRFFNPVRADLHDLLAQLELVPTSEFGNGDAERRQAAAAARHLDAATRQSTTGPAPATPASASAALAAAAELERARLALADVARMVPDSVRHQITGAADRMFWRLAWTCAWLVIVLALSVAVHVMQYRSLVRPLLWLRDDMKLSAAANYKDRVRARGEQEYRDVAALFNGLARELADLYKNLEAKVVQRSRELVRSERLASVGFLAAGVAHEINNPLSVISGYAELAGNDLRRVLDSDTGGTDAAAEAEAEALAAALEAQDVIRTEAFRCKEITSRLLSLARGSGDGREPLGLDDVARQVAVLTKGLKNYRDRRVTVDLAPDAGPLLVTANPTEMKQVILNLTVNALEAVPAGRGEVRIGGRRDGPWVEVWVQDNGKGMTADTLDQVFEPFFTAKRGQGEPGTGLGLSITHAIIENHGGTIRADSDGPGHGSRFTLRLPAGKLVTPAASVASNDDAKTAAPAALA